MYSFVEKEKKKIMIILMIALLIAVMVFFIARRMLRSLVGICVWPTEPLVFNAQFGHIILLGLELRPNRVIVFTSQLLGGEISYMYCIGESIFMQISVRVLLLRDSEFRVKLTAQ